jgi:hypothetical protein
VLPYNPFTPSIHSDSFPSLSLSLSIKPSTNYQRSRNSQQFPRWPTKHPLLPPCNPTAPQSPPQPPASAQPNNHTAACTPSPPKSAKKSTSSSSSPPTTSPSPTTPSEEGQQQYHLPPRRAEQETREARKKGPRTPAQTSTTVYPLRHSPPTTPRLHRPRNPHRSPPGLLPAQHFPLPHHAAHAQSPADLAEACRGSR